MDTQQPPMQSFPSSLGDLLYLTQNPTRDGFRSNPRASGDKTGSRGALLSLTVRLLHGTQLLKQPLVGQSGCHEELILGKEVVNELLFHIPCLERTKKAEVGTEQVEESEAWRRMSVITILTETPEDTLRPQDQEVTCNYPLQSSHPTAADLPSLLGLCSLPLLKPEVPLRMNAIYSSKCNRLTSRLVRKKTLSISWKHSERAQSCTCATSAGLSMCSLKIIRVGV